MKSFEEFIREGISNIQRDLWNDLYQLYTFKVGDKVRYKNYHNIKGAITTIDHTGKNILINDTLMCTPDEIELDVDVFIDNEPIPQQPASTKYKCTCTMRELMMKGCTKHE